MTAREIFEKVRAALLRQNVQSIKYIPCFKRVKCAYRGINQNKCAIGHLIPNKKYRRCMEGNPIRNIFIGDQELKNILLPSDLTYEDGITFLTDLQYIHDYYEPERWEKRFNEFEKKYFPGEWSEKIEEFAQQFYEFAENYFKKDVKNDKS